MVPLALVGLLAADPAPPAPLVERARALVQSLDYDQALPLVRKLLADPTTPPDQRAEAFALEGSILAVTADISEAERPFRKLLRLSPDYELPPKTPPKILAAFRKVQVEEKALAQELESSRQKQRIARMHLVDALPQTARGSKPFKVALGIFDPDGAVASAQLPYRRAGDASFSVLALTRDATGRWAGTLPAELTSSDKGFALELYLATADEKGRPLLTAGTAEAPLKVEISAGSRKPVGPSAVVAGIVVTAVALAAAVGLTAGTVITQHDYNQLFEGTTAVNAIQYASLRDRGEAFNIAVPTAWSVMGLAAAVTIVLAFLADWSPN